MAAEYDENELEVSVVNSENSINSDNGEQRQPTAANNSVGEKLNASAMRIVISAKKRALNNSVVRRHQTLKANNTALARSLSLAKEEVKILRGRVLRLQFENQDLHRQLENYHNDTLYKELIEEEVKTRVFDIVSEIDEELGQARTHYIQLMEPLSHLNDYVKDIENSVRQFRQPMSRVDKIIKKYSTEANDLREMTANGDGENNEDEEAGRKTMTANHRTRGKTLAPQPENDAPTDVTPGSRKTLKPNIVKEGENAKATVQRKTIHKVTFEAPNQEFHSDATEPVRRKTIAKLDVVEMEQIEEGENLTADIRRKDGAREADPDQRGHTSTKSASKKDTEAEEFIAAVRTKGRAKSFYQKPNQGVHTDISELVRRKTIAKTHTANLGQLQERTTAAQPEAAKEANKGDHRLEAVMDAEPHVNGVAVDDNQNAIENRIGEGDTAANQPVLENPEPGRKRKTTTKMAKQTVTKKAAGVIVEAQKSTRRRKTVDTKRDIDTNDIEVVMVADVEPSTSLGRPKRQTRSNVSYKEPPANVKLRRVK